MAPLLAPPVVISDKLVRDKLLRHVVHGTKDGNTRVELFALERYFDSILFCYIYVALQLFLTYLYGIILKWLSW